MNQSVVSPDSSPPRVSRSSVVWAWALIALATVTAYWGSFGGALLFDDRTVITENDSIRSLSSLSHVLSPPKMAGTGGRPFANFSYAINYAISGTQLWSYHALNLAIHVAAALLLFGVVRRTLLQPALRARFGADALPLAAMAAALWALHPLQTQSVTYLSQRTEELMGLCYLATVYAFIRGAETASLGWRVLAIAACLCGMASKEVMVTAPVMVLLYDRTFVAGTFREAMRRRWRFYLAAGSTWLLLPWLMHDLGARGVGIGIGVSSFDYALTECRAVMLYLKLVWWPHPQVFDYGSALVQHWAEAAGYATALGVLLAGTLAALWRWPILGFCASWFFVILAPASSVVPVVQQPMAESRMYLSLASPIALTVLGIYALCSKRSSAMVLALGGAFALLAMARNHVYHDEISLWANTADRCPDNPRAHYNLGLGYDKPGSETAAIAEYTEALRLKPDHAGARINLGRLLDRQDRAAEAVVHLQRAVSEHPDLVEGYVNYGLALIHVNRLAEAAAILQQALTIKPDSVEAHLNLSVAQEGLGRMAEAVATLQHAVNLKPNSAQGHFQLGYLLLRMGRTAEASVQLQEVLRLDPDHVDAHFSLGTALFRLQRLGEAQEQFEAASRLKPDSSEIQNNLGTVLMQRGELPSALQRLERAVQLKPDYAEARYNLGTDLLKLSRWSEAQVQFEIGARLQPDNAEIQNNLGFVLTKSGDIAAAVAHFERAVQLKPDYEEARNNLAALRAQPGAPKAKD